MKKKIKLIILSSSAILIFLLLIVTYIVESQVQEICKKAVSLYPGGKIQALIKVSINENTCTKDKSRALCALGKLGDKKALPYLVENFGGKEETNICIFEAQKRLKRSKMNHSIYRDLSGDLFCKIKIIPKY